MDDFSMMSDLELEKTVAATAIDILNRFENELTALKETIDGRDELWEIAELIDEFRIDIDDCREVARDIRMRNADH